jgi:sugar O-acyltransferase (sialic acid O-acetyltransferase NeuD family)
VTKTIIYGAGENGFQAYHCLRHDRSIELIGFADDDPRRHGTTYLGLPVIGDFTAVRRLCEEHRVECAIAAVGDNYIRARLTRTLRAAGLRIVQAIHPQVMIESPQHIGEGVIFEMGAAVHAAARVGDGVFMGTASMAAHHCVIGEYTIMSGGVSLGGRVTIGAYTLMGVGASVRPQISIGSNVVVGVGAAVVRDVPDNVVVVGVPARIVRERQPGDPP